MRRQLPGCDGRHSTRSNPVTRRRVALNFPGCSDPSRFPFIEAVDSDCFGHAFPRTNNDRTGETTSKFGKFDLRLLNEGESGIVDPAIGFPSESKSTDHLIVFWGSNLGDNACGDPLLVIRVDAGTWTIEAAAGGCVFPDDDAEHPLNCGAADCDSACLFEVGKGNKSKLTDIDFAMSFKITIVAQP